MLSNPTELSPRSPIYITIGDLRVAGLPFPTADEVADVLRAAEREMTEISHRSLVDRVAREAAADIAARHGVTPCPR